MPNHKFDLIVIGGGPGGYVASIRAAQLGKKVACVDDRPALGGTCLNVGCIPSKALLEASEKYNETLGGLTEFGITVPNVSFDLSKMMKRKADIVDKLTGGIDFLFKKNKITRYTGKAVFEAPGIINVSGNAPTTLTSENILIATGSVPASLKGVEIDGDLIGTSEAALSYSDVPKRLIVIGAGVIGLELGSVWARLGSEVTFLEYAKQILPGVDPEIAKIGARSLKKQGLKINLNTKVASAKIVNGECVVEVEAKDPLKADRVLTAVGRRPNTSGLGLEAAGVEIDKQGFIKTNEQFKTNAPGIYAIGDVIGGPMLAHKASDEAIACVEQLFAGYGHINYAAIPSVVYTDPEIASVGKTEDQLKTDGVSYKKGSYRFSANGRAMTLSKIEGLVKILAHAKTDRILGVHIIGPRAGDLIAEAAVAMEFHASSEDLARTCHAHPSLSEVIKEAALNVENRAIHS